MKEVLPTYKLPTCETMINATFSLALVSGLMPFASLDGPMIEKSGQDLVPASPSVSLVVEEA